jgi:hypothetical protein
MDRQESAVRPFGSGFLLFRRGSGRGCVLQHVVHRDMNGLPVGCDFKALNADHLSVTPVGFFDRALIDLLHGDAGLAGVTLERRFGPI